MGNDLLAFAVFLVGLVLLASPILAVMALVRLRELKQEVGSLRSRVDYAEQQRVLERKGPDTRSQATEAPAGTEAPEVADIPDGPDGPGVRDVRGAPAAPGTSAPGTLTPDPLPPSRATAPPEDPRPLQALGSTRPKPPPAPSEFAKLRARLDAGRKNIEWERWIGVRGAAVVGGIVMALAAILFFRHAFVQGWVSHEVRVLGGIGFGIASILVGARLRSRDYRVTPNALEGAGVVALYAAIWAADQRYQLISMVVSFPAMCVVTALACFLSLRHRSLLTALLGLIGGFATPLLLSSGSDRPIELFSYVLFLDLGLCFVARRGKWPLVGSLAMGGTLLLQGLWIYGRMEERIGLGLVLTGLFALFFVVAGTTVSRESRSAWLLSQVGSLLGAFVFAFHFSTRTDVPLGQHLWPTALLLGVLNVGAHIVGRMPRTRHLPRGAALASFFVGTVWFFHVNKSSLAPFWELSASGLGLILIPQVMAERFRSGGESLKQSLVAAALANGGWTALLVFACASLDGLDPWASWLGLLGCTLLWTRQSAKLELGLVPLGGVGLGAGLSLAISAGIFRHVDAARELGVAAGSIPDARLLLALPAMVSAAMLFAAWKSRGVLARSLTHAAWAQLIVFLPLLPSEPIYDAHQPWLGPLAASVYAALSIVAALRLGHGRVLALALLGNAYLIHFWYLEYLAQPRSEEALLQALGWVLVTPWILLPAPLLLHGRFRRPWVPGAVGGLFLCYCYLPAWSLFRARFESLEPGVEWVLAIVGFALCALLRKGFAGEAEAGLRRTLGWMLCVSLLFVASGLANVLEGDQEEAIQLAVFGLFLAAVGRRLRLGGPPLIALASSSLAFAVLFFTFMDDGAYARSEALIGAWVSYFHLVPAACFAAVAWLNARRKPSSSSHRVLRLLDRQTRIGPGLFCIVAIFLWLNLVVSNFFETSDDIRFFSERPPEQDLSLSIAWGLYAVTLLSLGTWSRQSGLRWTSLALFIITLGKVFLHDLGHLEGLYRVGSLAGLALGLLFVSLFYQRFVFRSQPAPPEEAT